jgi:hypothetical protein
MAERSFQRGERRRIASFQSVIGSLPGMRPAPSMLCVGIAESVSYPCHYSPHFGSQPALPVGLHWRRDCWEAPSSLASGCHWFAPLKRSWPGGRGCCDRSLRPGFVLLALAGTNPVQRPCPIGTACRISAHSWQDLSDNSSGVLAGRALTTGAAL